MLPKSNSFDCAPRDFSKTQYYITRSYLQQQHHMKIEWLQKLILATLYSMVAAKRQLKDFKVTPLSCDYSSSSLHFLKDIVCTKNNLIRKNCIMSYIISVFTTLQSQRLINKAFWSVRSSWIPLFKIKIST